MKRNIRTAFIIVGLFGAGGLCAQSVLYASAGGYAPAVPIDVIGRAGNCYWIQKSKKSSFRKRATLKPVSKEGTFEVYDARLNLLQTIPYSMEDTVAKQYLVTGARYFDQLLFTNTPGKTSVLLNRYTPEGTGVSQNVLLLTFPGRMKGNDFLLLRSQDQTKILLLGFEPVADATPRVHAVLYNSDWNVLWQTVYQDANLTQPVIQYDFTNYPLVPFDNGPVKLANNGDWLTVVPSRRNNNHVLFHFQDSGSSVVQTELKLPRNAGVQSASLFLDDARNEAFAGILLHTGSSPVKKVRTAHYLLSQCRFDFDTTFRFSTLAAGKTKEEHLFEHDFIPVPGKGFLFLKEYGRLYHSPYPVEAARITGDEEETPLAATGPVRAALNKGEYTRFGDLSGKQRHYDRGDLSLYYFPATRRDSCWSGLINKAQTSELNTSFLSYACLPMEGNIILLYNNVSYSNAKRSSSTILNSNGEALDEGVIFWRPGLVLDFQKARQLAARELAVPYDGSRGPGFAIIRL